MRRARLLALIVLTLVPFASCSKKDECEACSSDDDCRSGFVCSTFSDGTRRCGSGTGSTSCPMR